MKRQMSNERGASTVEFALILPLLIVLIFGVVESAIAFGDYLAVTHAAREGARLAAVGKYSEQVVRDRAYPVSPTSVSILYPNGNSHGEPVEVRVEYNIHVNIPFFGDRSWPMAGQAQMRLEG